MTEFLITNGWTGEHTWTAGASLSEALGAHENARRAAAGEVLLSRGWKIGSDHQGYISAWLGESYCRGLRCNVVREG